MAARRGTLPRAPVTDHPYTTTPGTPGCAHPGCGQPHDQHDDGTFTLDLATTHRRHPGRMRCCDDHTTTCEPPSELCCDACPERNHPWHPIWVNCVLDDPGAVP
jgi:hypothetical protein